MINCGLENKSLEPSVLDSLTQLRNMCAGDIIKAVTLAGSGHPGGSLSSLDALILLYATIRHNPKDPQWQDRDRVIVSHGHISAGTYSVLSRYGYFPSEPFFSGFRRAGWAFSGHVETCVPGVNWNTGNLGQGLSTGTATALAAKIKGSDYRTFVLMGDGEQQKGQIAEARRFAAKYSLDNLIALIDYNQLQISGAIGDIMPHDIYADWKAAGWNVIKVDNGHDFQSLYGAIRKAYKGDVPIKGSPVAIMVSTVMGKGISFMENLAKYHGTVPKLDQASLALSELNLDNDIELLQEKRQNQQPNGEYGNRHAPPAPWPEIIPGPPIVYPAGTELDNRSAYGNALADIAGRNVGDKGPKVVGITCDLEGSVKMNMLRKQCPQAFFECGIQEHHAATLAGALSREGLVPFFSTFGVFGIAETYNQHRLSDINEACPKVALTHCGIDVGEDGPTHQCIDYIGLGSNLFGFEIFHPADANQTDRMIRTLATHQKPSLICMGRSPVPMVTKPDGTLYYDNEYHFEVGKADVLRDGDDVTIMAYGPTIPHSLVAAAHLEAHHDLHVRVLNFATLNPLDRQAVKDAAIQTGLLVTVEDHNLNTGLGMLVAGCLVDLQLSVPLRRMGVSHYSSSGSPAHLFEEQGIDSQAIIEEILKLTKKKG